MKTKIETEMKMTSELELSPGVDAPQVSGFGLMTLAVAMLESAKDGVFRAIVASALTQVAVHENWGGDTEAKRLTVKQVRDQTGDAFGIVKGKSQAALWLALSVKLSVKLHKELRPTLDAARQMPDADGAFSIVAAALRESIGGNGLGQLENYLAGKAKEAKVKTLGERVIAALGKVEEIGMDDLKAIAEMVSAEMHRQIAAMELAQRAADLRETAADEKAVA